jgi:nucleoside-diphosphate-sugar epimerase
MKILVIGGTGFIGAYVVRRLTRDGHDVSVFHRGQTEADFPSSVQQIYGDRKRLSDFADEFKEIAPDVVLDLNPYSEEDAVLLLNTFRGVTGRVVALSSQDVYRSYGVLWKKEQTAPNTTPITEDAPVRTVLYPYRSMAKDETDFKYSYDKIPVERVVMNDADLPGTVLRLPAVYGPGDGKHRWFEYLKRMDDKRPVIFLKEELARWRWTRGYVETIADAIALATTDERAAGRIYNLGEPDTLTEAQWVRALGDAAGWNGEIRIVPKSELPAHLDTPFDYEHDLEVDTSRIRCELGYEEKIPRREALRRTVEWERMNAPDAIDLNQYDYRIEDAAFQKLQN